MINLKLAKTTTDNSRWTMVHELWKNGNTLAAIVTVDGASIDTNLRKLAKPPQLFSSAFEHLPRTVSFEYIERK